MAGTKPARGTRDLLPADIRKRNYVVGIIRDVYESYGFEPIETPAFEDLATLTGKYGEEGNQLIFKILKRGEKLTEALTSQDAGSLSDLALRYDLTVPLARVVANNRNELPKFFKRYQIQPVWRADRPARGRYREFYQCDVDAIGSTSMVVEAELISAVCEIFERLGFKDFVVRINHRERLRSMVEGSGIAADKTSDALVALDKLDKIGPDGVRGELISRGIDEAAADKFLAAATAADPKPENTDLEMLLRLLDGDARVRLDPSLARGLSYYTGTIMEVNVPDLAGSLAGGGRYDGLIGMFGKEQIPACGVSLGLERILVVMDERGMFPPEIAEAAAADVMVTLCSDETASTSLKLARGLRDSGLRVTVYPEPDKLAKQLKYASAIGVKYVCVLGETEIAENTVTIKDMRSGEQVTLDHDAAAAHLAAA